MKTRIAATFLSFAAIIVAGHAAQPRLRIASLHPVLTEIAREIGGDLVSVASVLPPGVDPHVFEPSAVDLRAIIDADLTLAAGLQLESYLDRLPARVGAPGRILSAGDTLPAGLQLRHDGHDHDHAAHDGHDHAHGPVDPHWWQSIDCVSFIAGRVGDELARLRPESSGDFARNTLAYRRRLAALKDWAAAEIARIPPARRHLVTSHEAFGYLARDHGFEVHSLSGLSTDSEPDARRLVVLIKLIRDGGVPAVFAENNANPRVIANIVSETGARAGGMLYADGPGPAGSGADTYETMYRHNIGVLVEALAPE